MKDKTWKESLKASLQAQTNNKTLSRLAVMGIGHELCGDDAVGVKVAEILEPKAAENARLFSIAAGPAPENFTGVLRRCRPDLVLLVDAAQMNQAPGDVRWLDPQCMEGVSASSHTLPLHILVAYLKAEFNCKVALLGIQPEQTFADQPLTKHVEYSAQEVAKGIMECLEENVPAGEYSPGQEKIDKSKLSKGYVNG